MAQIIPFKALRYNQNIVSGNDVIAPPYDVISEQYRETLYSKSPYNIVRIDFGKDEAGDVELSKYKRANSLLNQWIKEGILIRDESPCFYGYEIEYKIGNNNYKMIGTFVLFKIEELGNGIYPHEFTHSKPKADRLNLMKYCLANLSPIFAIYRSNMKTSQSFNQEPVLKVTDADGFRHLLYKMDDNNYLKDLMIKLIDKPVFIADGHHRYEVALEFKKLADNGLIDGIKEHEGIKPWDYVLMFLVDIDNSDITVLPTHRLVKSVPGGDDIINKLDKHFEITQMPYNNNPEEMSISLKQQHRNTFGLFLGNDEWFLLKYKQNGLEHLPSVLRDIDTVILQELILKEDLKTEDIYYEMDLQKAISMTGKGEYKALFVLNPTNIEDIERVAIKNLRMPPKSTYFFPKLLTGMVINTFF